MMKIEFILSVFKINEFSFCCSFQVAHILSIDRAKLESACVHLKVDVFSDEEYAFLVEYHKVISLVANALKSLEADRYTFGLYLPTLIGLKLKLQALFDGNTIIHCLPLVVALQNGLERRFGELMDPYH